MKKILSFILAAAMLLALVACEDDSYEENDSDSKSSSDTTRSSVTMTVDDDGGLQIDRPTRDETVSMGEDGTWTIFVYLCGTDLESDSGMGAADMEEMEEASTGENMRFIVETGGAYSWYNDVDADSCQRYEICNGTTTLVDETELSCMGESSTLAEFLLWGIENYASEYMGLVLWNHGGGSVTGVCFDETDDDDSLSLRELDAALLSAYEVMTDQFEFIGFDACLMGTVECANVLASYADYMYGSEEMEPGYGWDYEAIGTYLGSNPDADGAALGKEVADSFYESCKEVGGEDSATFSIIELSKVDALLTAFNSYSQSLYNATEDEETLAQVVRGAVSADNFGGNNQSEGYTNMVDLEGIIEAGSDCAEGADAALAALEDAVVYVKNGSDHADACGLAVYYPLEIQGSSELETFGQIAVSPYYLSFVDRAAYSASSEDGAESYDNEDTLDFWGLFEYFLDDDGYYEEDEDYYEDYYEENGEEDYWSYYDDYEPTGESSLITFDQEPAIDEDGYYTFVLSEDALNQTASIQASVFELSEDGEDLIDLGTSVDLNIDWDTGEVYDNFDGCWFSLPDGQNLAVYMVSECDGYDIYTSPVVLNGEDTNLRITHNYVDGTITIDGAWGGIDESGMADKDLTQLREGDEIVPLYDAYAVDSDDEYEYIGETYVFDGTPEIYYDYLPDGNFFYGFMIDDLYGDYYVTDYVQFDLEDGEVYYYMD